MARVLVLGKGECDLSNKFLSHAASSMSFSVIELPAPSLITKKWLSQLDAICIPSYQLDILKQRGFALDRNSSSPSRIGLRFLVETGLIKSLSTIPIISTASLDTRRKFPHVVVDASAGTLSLPGLAQCGLFALIRHPNCSSEFFLRPLCDCHKCESAQLAFREWYTNDPVVEAQPVQAASAASLSTTSSQITDPDSSVTFSASDLLLESEPQLILRPSVSHFHPVYHHREPYIVDVTDPEDLFVVVSDDDDDQEPSELSRSNSSSRTSFRKPRNLQLVHSATTRRQKNTLKKSSQFACQITVTSFGANNRIAEVLSEMSSLCGVGLQPNDVFRARHYQRLADKLRRHENVVDSPEALSQITGLTDKDSSKILEIIQTGTCQKFDELKRDTKLCVMRDLSKIHGVGKVIAREWADAGVTSIEDLRHRVQSGIVQLRPDQALSLRYLEDLVTKIPRDEVRDIYKHVRNVIDQILPGCCVICCGSYRRGKSRCGDVDILVTHQQFSLEWSEQIARFDETENARCIEENHRWLLDRLDSKSGADPIELHAAKRQKRENLRIECRHLPGIFAPTLTLHEPTDAHDANRQISKLRRELESKCQLRRTWMQNWGVQRRKSILAEVCRQLEQSDGQSPFLSGKFSDAPHLIGHDDSTACTMMMICKLPVPGAKHRRLDIKLYPAASFPYALMYFTGLSIDV